MNTIQECSLQDQIVHKFETISEYNKYEEWVLRASNIFLSFISTLFHLYSLFEVVVLDDRIVNYKNNKQINNKTNNTHTIFMLIMI